MSYQIAAVNAARVSSEYGVSPVKTWQLFVEDLFPNSESAQDKGCPKSTFLGLCEAGLVKGIPKGKYTTSVDNKRYAIAAVNILTVNQNETYTPALLWQLVLATEADQEKRYNQQMHVVLALWDGGLIERVG